MADIDTLAGTQSGSSCLDSVYNDLVELNTEFGAHTHVTGGVVILRIVASYANLSTGTVDGELKVTADTNIIYSWDSSGAVWRMASGISIFRAQLFS